VHYGFTLSALALEPSGIFNIYGGLQIPYCRGIAVVHHGFTLGALAMEPTGLCSV
jgi:hypothetical protein